MKKTCVKPFESGKLVLDPVVAQKVEFDHSLIFLPLCVHRNNWKIVGLFPILIGHHSIYKVCKYSRPHLQAEDHLSPSEEVDIEPRVFTK